MNRRTRHPSLFLHSAKSFLLTYAASLAISPSLLALGVFAADLVARPSYAQQWQQNLPDSRTQHAVAYDSARDRLVMFGGLTDLNLGNDTFEWNGTRWEARTSAGATPAARQGHAMVFDAARGRTLLFGGFGGPAGGLLSDTWEWDGVAWRQLAPATSPSARDEHAMVFDTTRQRVILFGGTAGAGLQNDVWEWTGTNWIAVTSSGTPPAPRESALAIYDAVGARMIVYGGWNGATTGTITYGDTFAFDPASATWTAHPAPVPAPGGRYDTVGGVTIDAAGTPRIVRFGGSALPAGGTPATAMYELLPTGWVALTSTGAPAKAAQQAAAAVMGPRGLVICGGTPVGGTLPFDCALDGWNSNGWTALSSAPARRASPAMAASGDGRVLLHGGFNAAGVGLNDTWLWNGSAWAAVASPVSGGRGGHRMAYDSLRGRWIFCAGLSASVLPNLGFIDTWAFNGTTWTQLATTGLPPVYGYTLAYDVARDRVVLYGGWVRTTGGGRTYMLDIYEFNGTFWQLVANNPGNLGRRIGAGSGYRAGSGVVIAGGTEYASNAALGPYVWNGTTMTQLSTFIAPGLASTANSHTAFDAYRDRLICNDWLGDQHEFSFATNTWTTRTNGLNPSEWSFGATAYDPASREILRFGGSNTSLGVQQNLRFFGSRRSGESNRYGEGCGPAGRGQLAANAPWVDRTNVGEPFALAAGFPSTHANGICVLYIGTQQFPPIDLGSVGMPGCMAHVAVATSVNLPLNGAAQVTLPLTVSPPIGARIYWQCLGLDPSLTIHSWTNALETVVGGR